MIRAFNSLAGAKPKINASTMYVAWDQKLTIWFSHNNNLKIILTRNWQEQSLFKIEKRRDFIFETKAVKLVRSGS